MWGSSSGISFFLIFFLFDNSVFIFSAISGYWYVHTELPVRPTAS